MPMLAANLLDSIRLLSRSWHVFTDNLLEGLKADEERFREVGPGGERAAVVERPKAGFARRRRDA